MEKIDLKITMNDAQKKYTEELIQSLSKEPFILNLLHQKSIPASLLEKYPNRFSRWLSQVKKCNNCAGLQNCVQKTNGMLMDLEYDENLTEICRPCKYRVQKMKEESHLKNYLLSDLSDNQNSISFDQIEIDKETDEYSEVVATAIMATKENQGLYLYGSMGTGKTYLAVCAANYYASNGLKVSFINVPTFVARMKSKVSTNEYGLELQRAIRSDFLVLDDIGAESVSAWIRDDILFTLLNARMERKLTTWFTSNEDYDSLLNHYVISSNGHEEKMKAVRILERIKTLSKPVKVLGKDRRNP